MSALDLVERNNGPEKEKHFRNAFVFKSAAKDYPIEYIMRALVTLKQEDKGERFGGVHVVQARTNSAYAICYVERSSGGEDTWWITKRSFRAKEYKEGATWDEAWKEATYDEVREFIEEELKTL